MAATSFQAVKCFTLCVNQGAQSTMAAWATVKIAMKVRRNSDSRSRERSVLFHIFIEDRRIYAKFVLSCWHEITWVITIDFYIMKLDFEFCSIRAVKAVPSADWASEDPFRFRFRGPDHTHIKSRFLSEINYVHIAGPFFRLCNNFDYNFLTIYIIMLT